ncbi:hypothetical protein BJX63DRAFT_115459 [Aspergillus granulosus]|uniref:Uncharacterized protein n=1 Tax=Aspergillus granulosus TaxID=176169 RepID=A0ABR4GTH9_9EURO
MAQNFLTARRRYVENVQRLSTTVPGYDQLARGIEGGDVSITRIDFGNEGYGHLAPLVKPDRDDTLSDPRQLYRWLREHGLENITTRYVLVEDIDTEIVYTLGATFGIELQFFLDHMNNQVSGSTPGERDHRIRWNTWNLAKPYLSFHWYRPVCRNRMLNGAFRRKQVEARYESVTSVTREFTRKGEPQNIYTLEVVRATSNTLRPEWDLSGSEVVGGEAELVAIDERASIYQTTLDGCQYVIMLLDAVPKESRATWTERASEPQKPYTPPDDTDFEVTDLYEGLVPRFTPDISAGKIPSLGNQELKEVYETMHSTMTCLWNNSNPANQVPTATRQSCKHLPFIHLFRIVTSDTLGLLHLLENIQSEIVQSTASQDAQIDDILSKRTFIANLHAYLPALSQELKKALKALLERGNGETSQHESIRELGEYFERTIQDLKEASNAITGTLQFIESHRAILEAESITRLTELAFLFIPLSFAASVFSMQIQELTSPVPVWNFIVFAVSLSTSTYALRLFARSAWVHRQKQAVLNSIRARSAVRPAAPIRNAVFFAWVIARIGPAMVVIFTVACFLVPLFGVIWTRQLDLGLKIGLSLLFLVFMASITGTVILAIPDLRRWLQKGMQIKWYNAVEEGAALTRSKPL